MADVGIFTARVFLAFRLGWLDVSPLFQLFAHAFTGNCEAQSNLGGVACGYERGNAPPVIAALLFCGALRLERIKHLLSCETAGVC